MDNSADEIGEIFKALYSGVQEALAEKNQESVEIPLTTLNSHAYRYLQGYYSFSNVEPQM